MTLARVSVSVGERCSTHRKQCHSNEKEGSCPTCSTLTLLSPVPVADAHIFSQKSPIIGSNDDCCTADCAAERAVSVNGVTLHRCTWANAVQRRLRRKTRERGTTRLSRFPLATNISSQTCTNTCAHTTPTPLHATFTFTCTFAITITCVI